MSEDGRPFAGKDTTALVLALDGVGDLVLRQPLLTCLAESGAAVHVLVQDGHQEIVPLLEPRATAWPALLDWTRLPTPEEFASLVGSLGSVQPDLLVRSQYNPVVYADWLLRAFPGARTAGFADGAVQYVEGWEALEPRLGLSPVKPLHIQVACAELVSDFMKAAVLGRALTGISTAADGPRIELPPEARAAAAVELRALGLAPGTYVACCPAGVKNVTLKAWPPARFAEVLAGLDRDPPLPALVLGHRREAALVDDVVSLLRGAGGHAVPWLGDRGDLVRMAALLARARLYLGNDTGAMHLAAALDLPVVAVCGGGHWPRFLPRARLGAVHTLELPCFGCGWRDCVFGDGPCVKGVSAEVVRASVQAVLNRETSFAVKREPLPPGDPAWPGNRDAFRQRTRALGEAMPLVSIVTPCLDAAAHVTATIESVRAQSHPAIQHLLVDGGSTDGTRDLLARTPGIAWTSAPDRSMYEAVNRGFRMAAGDVLAYQNSDDVYAGPDAVARAVAAFAAHPEADVVYGDFRYVDEEGRPLRVVRAPEFGLATLRRSNFIPPHSAFVRRRVVHERGFWLDPSLRFAGDWDWFLRMAIGGCTFVHVPEVLSVFRRRTASLTATLGFRAKLAEWRAICRRTGTPLVPLVWHEAVWLPLRRRLAGSGPQGPVRRGA